MLHNLGLKTTARLQRVINGRQITLQARQADGSWRTRNAFADQNKRVIAGTMTRKALIELAMSVARKWHATHDTPCELRVHDSCSEDITPPPKPKVDTPNMVAMPIIIGTPMPSPWAACSRWGSSYAAIADAAVTKITSSVMVPPDSYLVDLIRAVGVDRILDIACQVEQQAA